MIDRDPRLSFLEALPDGRNRRVRKAGTSAPIVAMAAAIMAALPIVASEALPCTRLDVTCQCSMKYISPIPQGIPTTRPSTARASDSFRIDRTTRDLRHPSPAARDFGATARRR